MAETKNWNVVDASVFNGFEDPLERSFADECNSAEFSQELPQVNVDVRIGNESVIPPPPYGPATSGPPPPCTSHCLLVLNVSYITNAPGLYKLPYDNGEGRVVRVDHDFRDWDPSIEFSNLIDRSPPERWADSSGNVVGYGSPSKADELDIILASSLTHGNHRRYGRYILVRRTKLERKSSLKVACPHLHGDPIYQWVSCPTWEHFEKEVVATWTNGWSIVANWGVSKPNPKRNFWQRLIHKVKSFGFNRRAVRKRFSID